MKNKYSLLYCISLALLILIISLSAGCTPKSQPATGQQAANNAANNAVLQAAVKDAPDSVYSQGLEAFNVGTADIKDSGATFTSANITVSEGLSAQTNIVYAKNSSGNFTGTMEITLHKTGTTKSRYVLNISKTFAKNINQLSFSIQPDAVLQADPVVAWNINKDGSITVKSDKVYSKDEMKKAAAEEAYNFQSVACDKIESQEESSVCSWRLIEKYKDEPFMKEQLAELDISSAEGAALRALMDGNYNMCTKYISGDAKDRCLQIVFRTREYECRSAKDQDACVRKILWPLGLNNIKGLCDFITGPEMKKECKGTIASDRCNELQDTDQKEKCLINIARASKDIKDCDKISSSDGKDACRKYLGEDNSNSDYCMKINDADAKDECIAMVALQKKDKELCKRIQGDDAKGLCLVFLMSEEGKIDKSVCDKMKSGWIKDMCIECYAVSVKDMSICSQVNDADSLHMCQMMVGVVLNDSRICATFKEESDRDLCYSMFGLILDKKYCAKIINEEMKKDCLKTPLPEKLKEANATNETKTAATATSGPCPVSPPATAHKYDQGSESGGWMIRYALPSGASVGQEMYYYDKAKTQIASSKCYNDEGELHGPFVIYNKDSTKSQEGNYKDGKMDGVSRDWYQGTLQTEVTYKDGRPDGKYTSYITIKGPTLGKVSYTGFYLGYKKVGDWKYYNSYTGALEEEATYDNDCASKDKTYYEDGSVKYEKTGTCTNFKFTGTEIQYAMKDSSGKQAKTTCKLVDNDITSCV
jgi:antitoxin component YwqK of YwqJK toxin-antitoxin module